MQSLTDFITAHPRLLVITGAGCSAASGIPTYRNDEGIWQRSQPIQHSDFINHFSSRQRYWARSLAGWPSVAAAEPGVAHQVLAAMEAAGRVSHLVTQNVDRLHQKAGHQRVTDLHGRLDRVVCLDCGVLSERSEMQARLTELNRSHLPAPEQLTPDGDADIDERLIPHIQVPACLACGGTLKPDVVFFGGSVPKPVVAEIYASLSKVDGVLVVGSSLMVFSSFRFCREAYRAGLPVAAVNRGKTRADELLTVKIEADCHDVLSQLPASLTNR
ncbi:MAG: NAD-dependent protein deacetylase [Pseudomonadales bacterium]|nr:NAD-dependent protein deacetylase [Pseudomonadales bacterium]